MNIVTFAKILNNTLGSQSLHPYQRMIDINY